MRPYPIRVQLSRHIIDAWSEVNLDPFTRIMLTADGDAPFTAMFEPSGMTYQLAAGEFMFADVLSQFTSELEIVNWQGGFSIWVPRTRASKADSASFATGSAGERGRHDVGL